MIICTYQTLASQDGENFHVSGKNKTFKTHKPVDAIIVVSTWNRRGEIGGLPKWKYAIIETRKATIEEWDDDNIPMRTEGSC